MPYCFKCGLKFIKPKSDWPKYLIYDTPDGRHGVVLENDSELDIAFHEMHDKMGPDIPYSIDAVSDVLIGKVEPVCDGSHHPVPVESDRFHRAVWIERAIRGVFTDAEFRRFGIQDENVDKFHPADPIIRMTRRFAGGSIQQEVVIFDGFVEVQFTLRPYRIDDMNGYVTTHRIFQAPNGLHSRIVDALSTNFRILEANHEHQLNHRVFNRFSDAALFSDPMIQFGGTQ